MTPFSLYPAFLRIAYRTRFAPHSQTLPVYNWSPPSPGNPAGTFLTATDTQINAQTAINDYVALLAPIFRPDTTINEAIVYTMAAPTGQAIPQVALTLTTVGTNTNVTWDEAVQITMTMRTSLFNKFKIVLLDVPSNDDYNKYTNFGTLNVIYQNLLNSIDNDLGFICGRDRGRPSNFISFITDLNDGLRQEYRLA